MIKKEDIVEIGKFQKTHALKGELNALLEVETDFAEYDFPLIVDIDGIYVPFYIDSIRSKGSESYLVKLRGVDDQEEARQFVNKSIYSLRKDMVEYFGGEEFEVATDFIGYKVIDEKRGEIGEICGLEDSTANVLFIVKRENESEVYIPASSDLLVEIDDDKKIIVTDLPEGLIDLN